MPSRNNNNSFFISGLIQNELPLTVDYKTI